MTCTDGIYIDGRRIDTRDCSGPRSARAVLLNPQVEAAVLETARGGILREGLGFDRCDVAVVTNIGEGDHLGLRGIETLEELARVKRAVVEAVGPAATAVLNADDPLVAADGGATVPAAVIFFARRRRSARPGDRTGAAAAGPSSFADGAVVLANGEREELLLPLAARAADAPGADRLPGRERPGGGGRGLVPGHAAGGRTRRARIVHGRRAAGARPVQRPAGRRRHRGHRLCAQSFRAGGPGRGPGSFPAPAAFGGLRGLQPPRRGRGGHGRDPGGFDRVLLYEDRGNRDRADGTLNTLLRQGITAGQRTAEVVEMEGELPAIAAALRSAVAGDLVVLGIESIEQPLRSSTPAWNRRTSPPPRTRRLAPSRLPHYPSSENPRHGNLAAETDVHIRAALPGPGVIVAVVVPQLALTAKAQGQRRRVQRAEDNLGVGIQRTEVRQVDAPEGAACPGSADQIAQQRQHPPCRPRPVDRLALLMVV